MAHLLLAFILFVQRERQIRCSTLTTGGERIEGCHKREAHSVCVSMIVIIPFLTALSALCQAQVASLTCKFTSI